MTGWPRHGACPALDAFFVGQPGLMQRAALDPGAPGRAFAARLERVIRTRAIGAPLDSLLDLMMTVRADPAACERFVDALVSDARGASERRTRAGRRASLWGVTPIINLIPCARADRLGGTDVCSLVFNTYRISDEFDLVLTPQSTWVTAQKGGRLTAYRWLIFTWALLRFDNFFLFNDQGLLVPIGGYGSPRFGINREELELLQRAGKALYTLAYGADHRSRGKTLALGRYNFCAECPDIGRFCICHDDEAEAMLETISAYSTANLTTGLSTYYFSRPRNLNYLIVELDRYAVMDPPARADGRLRILHCPNHQHFKGTHFLEEAVARLQAEDVPVELRLVSGVSNKVVLEEMRDADIVADQFLGGMFGYTAIEAMALGRPVLCYLAHDDLVPEPADCPVINASPDNLYEVLKETVARRESLPLVGRRSREYVERHFSMDPFSERLLGLYRDTVPGFRDPRAASMGRRLAGAVERRVGRGRAGSALRGAVIGLLPERDRLRHLRGLFERSPTCFAFARMTRRALDAALHAPRNAVRFAGRVVGHGLTRATMLRRRLAGTWRRALTALPLAASGTLVALAVPLGRLATAVRLHLGRPRSVWGVTPILTLRLLSRCDRDLGLASESLVFTTYSVTSNFDVNLQRLTAWVTEKHPRQYRFYAQCVFAWALLRYDVFNCFFDRGVEAPLGRMGFNESELVALSRANKRLYVYTYGADVRTRERTLALGKYNFCSECPEIGRYCICDEGCGRDNTDLVSRYATAMLAMGDMCAYVPGHREQHFWPIDTARIPFHGVRERSDGTLRIAHATNQPWFKGTEHLVAVVDRLRREGLPVELVSVSGLPNAEVLRVFGTVDVVAEQFLGGFHGYTALEAMAVGKPVISYIRDRARLADARDCPIISATPDELETVLRDCLAGKYDFDELGRRGRRYVEKYYAIDAVARELARTYLETANFPRRIARRMRRAAGLAVPGSGAAAA